MGGLRAEKVEREMERAARGPAGGKLKACEHDRQSRVAFCCVFFFNIFNLF